MLVWNPADTTRKNEWFILFLLCLKRHAEYAKSFHQIRNLELLSVVDPFL